MHFGSGNSTSRVGDSPREIARCAKPVTRLKLVGDEEIFARFETVTSRGSLR